MENKEKLPKKEEQSEELEQTVAPADGGCPDGYYYDEETGKCILDVGNGQ